VLDGVLHLCNLLIQLLLCAALQACTPLLVVWGAQKIAWRQGGQDRAAQSRGRIQQGRKRYSRAGYITKLYTAGLSVLLTRRFACCMQSHEVCLVIKWKVVKV
jgi:hypothetical protein